MQVQPHSAVAPPQTVMLALHAGRPLDNGQPYAGAHDTALSAVFPTRNFGANDVLGVGDDQGVSLLTFDLDMLPKDAPVVVSETLRLYMAGRTWPGELALTRRACFVPGRLCHLAAGSRQFALDKPGARRMGSNPIALEDGGPAATPAPVGELDVAGRRSAPGRLIH